MKAKENLRRESVGPWEKVLMAYEQFVVLPKTSHLGHVRAWGERWIWPGHSDLSLLTEAEPAKRPKHFFKHFKQWFKGY